MESKNKLDEIVRKIDIRKTIAVLIDADIVKTAFEKNIFSEEDFANGTAAFVKSVLDKKISLQEMLKLAKDNPLYAKAAEYYVKINGYERETEAKEENKVNSLKAIEFREQNKEECVELKEGIDYMVVK